MNAQFDTERTTTWRGFTLSELLLALLILGVIATFAIPKILQTSYSKEKSAVAKEDLSAVSSAFTQYTLQNPTWQSLQLSQLAPYLNYVRIDSTTIVDGPPSGATACGSAAPSSIACSNVTPGCLVMHNGSYLMLYSSLSPASMCPGPTCTGSAGGYVAFMIDPDGKLDGDGNITFALEKNGRVTEAQIEDNTKYIGTTPSWFSW